MKSKFHTAGTLPIETLSVGQQFRQLRELRGKKANARSRRIERDDPAVTIRDWELEIKRLDGRFHIAIPPLELVPWWLWPSKTEEQP